MRLILLVFIAAILAGCNIFPKPSAVHDFGLTTNQPSFIRASNIQPDIVSVEAPKWLYDNRIRYRLLYVEPTQIKYYALDRWLAPPPELFEQLLLAGDLDAAQQITVQLLEFEQQFKSADQANVVMSFRVIVPKNAAHKEKFKDFRQEQACRSANAEGAITAFSTLTRKSVQAINTWLQQQP